MTTTETENFLASPQLRPRDGDLFTLKPSAAGGVVIDLSQQIVPPARAGMTR